ncbi:hypothetical protein L3X38_021156 [Prunus dulcis]|uniref:Uncharacterized protein n=1 Tax=Prunus dulcis TaxID=3755 RepID=A0AAD4Z335_PRUDU|nr:hypothetical protein L3X38_021156 [Prunus dulcis]
MKGKAVKIGRRRPLLLQFQAKPQRLEAGASQGWKRTSSRSFWYRPRPQPWPVAGVSKERSKPCNADWKAAAEEGGANEAGKFGNLHSILNQ